MQPQEREHDVDQARSAAHFARDEHHRECQTNQESGVDVHHRADVVRSAVDGGTQPAGERNAMLVVQRPGLFERPVEIGLDQRHVLQVVPHRERRGIGLYIGHKLHGHEHRDERNEQRSPRCPEPPAQIIRHPLPQTEATLARGAICPRRRNFTHAAALQVCFDRQLECDLETGLVLRPGVLQELLRVRAEVARRVFGSDARDPIERDTREVRQSALQEWPARLRTTAHVARARHDCEFLTAHELGHLEDVLGRIRQIAHRRHDDVTLSRVESRAQCIGCAATARVLH